MELYHLYVTFALILLEAFFKQNIPVYNYRVTQLI